MEVVKIKHFGYERRYIIMKYIIRIIQVSTLLGGAEFMLMLLFGDLTESVKPIVLGAVSISLIISAVLDIIDRRLASKKMGYLVFYPDILMNLSGNIS